jgi:hypothetical protein
MRKAAIAVAIIACLAFVALVVFLRDPSMFQSIEYQSCAAARADELFGRGWVPDVLPTECGPIIEAHNLDTNDRCSRSKFAPEATPQVRASLEALGFTPYPGELPETPFARCPFSREQARGAATFRRPCAGHLNDFEYAAVSNSGVLYCPIGLLPARPTSSRTDGPPTDSLRATKRPCMPRSEPEARARDGRCARNALLS